MRKEPRYRLRLFVTGTAPRSARAIRNVLAICKDYLPRLCELEAIDIYHHPEHVRGEQIVVTPALVKQSPLPVRKLIGDPSNTARALAGLDVVARPLVAQPREKNVAQSTENEHAA